MQQFVGRDGSWPGYWASGRRDTPSEFEPRCICARCDWGSHGITAFACTIVSFMRLTCSNRFWSKLLGRSNMYTRFLLDTTPSFLNRGAGEGLILMFAGSEMIDSLRGRTRRGDPLYFMIASAFAPPGCVHALKDARVQDARLSIPLQSCNRGL